VDEVDDDGDGDVAAGGLGGDPVDLVVVAVDEGDPGALALGVAAGGLVEDRGDDVGGGVGDADGEPLVPGDRSRGPAWGGRRLASIAARRRCPCECFSAGRLSAASAGCRLLV
jgi:hypothetical protein